MICSEEIAVYGQKMNYFVHSLLCQCNDHTDSNCLKSICCCSFIIIPSQFHFSITSLCLSLPSLSLLLSHPFLFPLSCSLSISPTNILTSHPPFSTYGHPSIFPHPTSTGVFPLLLHVTFVSHHSTILFFPLYTYTVSLSL